MSNLPSTLDITGRYVASATLATLPSATNYPVGTSAFATNVGLNGTEMVVSSSGTWIPHNGRALLSRLTLPVVKAPTIPADASASANGAITFGTAVGTAYAKCYCYFGANVVNGTQPAGFYYMEMSTTTAAIVYNNLYTPAAGTYPTEPTSKTAFAGAVPGGAGVTTEVTAFAYKLNGGLLGLYGELVLRVASEMNAGTGKTVKHAIDGNLTSNYGSVSTTVNMQGLAYTRNIGSQSRQRSTPKFNPALVISNEIVTTVDTSVDATCSVTLTASGAATDWIALTEFAASVEVA